MNGIETLWAAVAADPGRAMQAVAWALVHFLWQGALVGLAAAGLLRALRPARASVRYGVAVAALALLALLPAATALRLFEARAAEPLAALSSGPASAAAAVSAPALPLQGYLAPLLPAVFAVWLLGVLVLGVAHLGGWWRLRRLVRQALPLGEEMAGRAARLARALRIGRAVRLLESAAVPVPAVIGWLRPAILVPASSVAGLTPWQLEAILAHELAHVRRHDFLVNLLQAAVETLLFYHPAVWWLSNEIRQERENCCDDLAVELCGDRLGYARALADLEGLRVAPSRLALAADGGSLVERVRRLTGAPGPGARDSRRSGLVGALILALVPAFLGLRWGQVEAAPRSGAVVVASERIDGRVPAGAPVLDRVGAKSSGPERAVARGRLRPAGVKAMAKRAVAPSAAAPEPVSNRPAGSGTDEPKKVFVPKRPIVLVEAWKNQSETALTLSRFPGNDLTRLLVLEKSPDFLGAMARAAKGDPDC